MLEGAGLFDRDDPDLNSKFIRGALNAVNDFPVWKLKINLLEEEDTDFEIRVPTRPVVRYIPSLKDVPHVVAIWSFVDFVKGRWETAEKVLPEQDD